VLRFPDYAEEDFLERTGTALLCGVACLPVLLDLAGRLGASAMGGLAVLLALAGTPALFRRPGLELRHWPSILGIVIWCVADIAFLVDWPNGSGLAHGYFVIDYVKHASATWSIASTGTPPWNPAAFDPQGHAAYYYFFYTLTAVVSLIGSHLGIEARHAAYAASPCMGLALFALVYAIWKRVAIHEIGDRAEAGPKAGVLILVFLFATGLDLLPNLFVMAISDGKVMLADPESWNTQVTSWLSNVLWVPHHLAALCAAMTGFMALAGDGASVRRAPSWRGGLLASLAFASMAGLSVYIAIGGALTAMVWIVVLVASRRLPFALRVGAAGSLSLGFAAPWLSTLAVRFGQPGAPPIAFAVRAFEMTDAIVKDEPSRSLTRLAFLPLSYGIEFGIFALGAWVFWQRVGRKGWSGDLRAILLIATVMSFAVGSFLYSTISNNDLGWRIMLFAQLATLIWTLSAVRAKFFTSLRLRAAAFVCIGLAYLFDAYTLFELRRNPEQTNLQRSILPDEIASWRWLDARLPAASVVQERPNVIRATSYGLYGHFPQAIADRENARLYGASQELIDRRMRSISPIFSDAHLSYDQVRAIAAAYKVDALVVSANDPVFRDPRSWVQATLPEYANQNVKVFVFNQKSYDK
jgi:hypothetical protein